MIMLQVRSPMLVAVGMYLPLGTTFAIFIGGMIRWATDELASRRGYNAGQMARVENAGVLTASGLIAGEGLMGLVTATFEFFRWPLPNFMNPLTQPLAGVFLALLAAVLVWGPLSNHGHPDDPAPPTAMM